MSGILLLNPPYTSLGYGTMRGLASRSFPSGLGMLSGVLKKNGVPFDVLDADALDMDIPKVAAYTAALKPRVIGISTYSSYASMAARVVTAIKNNLRDTVIVLGGHHAFAIKGRIIDETGADIAAIG